MSTINLNLPSQAVVLGALRTRSEPSLLDQDMLQIELPGQVFVCVGWYPDKDPAGEYRLTVFESPQETQKQPQLRTRDIKKVVAAIHACIRKYLSSASSLIPVFVNGAVVSNIQETRLDASVRGSSVILPGVHA